MNRNLQSSPNLGYPIDGDDTKYVSGLSTILVATIQEAKDRISQIEYIFCSQLFPNFQSKSKSLQKVYLEARKAAEDECKIKENELNFQVEKLNLEKQQALELNNAIQLEMAKLSKEHEENANSLLAKLKNLDKKVGELEQELLQKSKEVDEGMELQNKLLQLVQEKTNAMINQGKELKVHEVNVKILAAKVKCLEKTVDELQEELKVKTEEIIKGKELQATLLKEIESRDLNVVNCESLLNDCENQKRLFAANVERLEGTVDKLQEELRKKTAEVEDGRKLREQVSKQIEFNELKVLKKEQQLEEHDKEKKLLLAKVKGLEEKFDELQVDLKGRSIEVTNEKEFYEKLLQLIESKDSKLLSEKKRTNVIVATYKNLKSQFNYLCKKHGHVVEDTLRPNKVEEECSLLKDNQNPTTSPELENKNSDASAAASDTNNPKNEIISLKSWENEKGLKSVQTSSSSSPFAQKCLVKERSAPLIGTKRSTSYWRGTRSHEGQDGVDPHDDFLDTPFEAIRGNLKKPMSEEVHDLPGAAPIDIQFDGSDDETQDMNEQNNPQKQPMTAPRPGTRAFKYVEPVRKKAEREILRGVECKQCKKFYDAVLSNGGKDANSNRNNMRCEHHDGVSRHRYQYVPPLTPEGFWNIGFESEL